MDAVKAYESLLETLLTKGNWNEEDHPRHPAGSGNGGQFAPAGGGNSGGDGDAGADDPAAAAAETESLVQDAFGFAELSDEVWASIDEYLSVAVSAFDTGNQQDWVDGFTGLIDSVEGAFQDQQIDKGERDTIVNTLSKIRNSRDFNLGKAAKTRKSWAARVRSSAPPRKIDSKLSVLPTREFKFVSASTENGQMTFEGYGAVFGNIDSHGDIIEPGAFKAYLDRVKAGEAEWPVMLLQHGGMGFGSAQDQTPIGVWEEVREDEHGLRVKGVLANTERGREVYELLRMKPRPAITGLSIGYSVQDSALAPMGSKAKRHLKAVNLAEISMVTFPSNGRARVTDTKMTARDLERKLTQDAGLTRSQARALMKQGASTLVAMRDAGE